MPISVGDWVFDSQNNVHKVSTLQGKGRNLIFASSTGASLFAQDCVPYAPPLDDFDDMRRMIDAADDSCAVEVYEVIKSCFGSDEDKRALWGQLSNAQKDRVKRFGEIVRFVDQQGKTGEAS
jgi:hypothetical protein